MAASGDAALRFGESIFEKVRDQFESEAQALREYRATQYGEEVPLLQPWEVGYWAEKQRKTHYET